MPNEFELIERYFRKLPARRDVVVAIGDDAAVVEPQAGAQLVITTDTLVEGIHFPRGTSARSIGHKALAVNLSDLAAMGAEPAWATLVLSLPEPRDQWLSDLATGFQSLASRYGVDLIGGDTTRGPLTITVGCFGSVPPDGALLRGRASPGDLIYVTGTLGDAGLALRATKGQIRLGTDAERYCLLRLNEPVPRVEAGLALRGLASAAIDVSDGLCADLGHILNASGVGATIEVESLPLSEPFCESFGANIDWGLALSAGDDYELVFTVAETNRDAIQARFRELDCGATLIGRIEARLGLRCMLRGQEYPVGVGGYEHFSG